MMHDAHLAVDDLMAAHDIAAKGLTDGLMAQTDPQQRGPGFGRRRRQGKTDAGLRRIAGAGGQHDSLGLQRHRGLHIQGIIAAHDNIRPQFAQIMHEVVGKAVVVIDEKQHTLPRDGCFGVIPGRGRAIHGTRRDGASRQRCHPRARRNRGSDRGQC